MVRVRTNHSTWHARAPLWPKSLTRRLLRQSGLDILSLSMVNTSCGLHQRRTFSAEKDS